MYGGFGGSFKWIEIFFVNVKRDDQISDEINNGIILSNCLLSEGHREFKKI